MKKHIIKIIGATILAIFAVITFMFFNQLTAGPKLLLLTADMVVYYLVMRYLIINRVVKKIISDDQCSSVASFSGNHSWYVFRFTRRCVNCNACDERSIEEGFWYIKSREKQ